MRLDLFLKTSRLVKRRMVARMLCDAGKALVNGRTAKPAREVDPGDTVVLTFPTRILEIRIIGLPGPGNRKTAPEELYRVAAEKRLPKDADAWSESPESS